MLLQTKELCYKTDNMGYYQMGGGEEAKKRMEDTAHQTNAVNTTMDRGHIHGTGQHFGLDVSCVQLN